MKKILSIIWNNIRLLLTKVYYSYCKRDKTLWIFGEWFGERCCDNCLFFANYLASFHPELTMVWITCKDTDLSRLSKKVMRCERDSVEAISYLKKAGVVVVTNGSDDISLLYKSYYSGALVLNLWHGIPWKKIHYNMPMIWYKLLYYKFRTKLYEGKVYLSTCDDFSYILQRAFGCKKDNIILSGYPRNICLTDNSFLEIKKRELIGLAKNLGLTVDDSSKVVIYLPTFRDSQNNLFSFEELKDDNRLLSILEKHNAIIIQKSHFASSPSSSSSFSIVNNRIIILREYQTQELLASSDMLITDYSSCFFDYLILDRPIIHFLYDYDYYSNDDRGLYFSKEKVACGSVIDNISNLVEAIDENLSCPEKYKGLRKKRREKFLQYESGDTCKTIYNEIISRIK